MIYNSLSRRFAAAEIRKRIGGVEAGPQWPATLFLLCGIFVALPFFDVPFIGLSVTAPLILPVFYYVFLVRFDGCQRENKTWLWLAGAIWAGMLASFSANAPFIDDREIDYLEYAYLFRYFFWLLVFVATSTMAADFRMQQRLSRALAFAVVALAGLRIFEAVVWGKVGAWTEPIFTTQNTYGILFSTFSPFLFAGLIGRRLINHFLTTAGLLTILYACALNGSRGSWISIAIALAVFLILTGLSRPSAVLRLILPLAIAAVAFGALVLGSPRLRETAFSRFETMEDLEMDKSYQIRQVLNQKNLSLFFEHPIFGIGPGRSKGVYVAVEMPRVLRHKTGADLIGKSAHNSYLSFLAEGGVLGTLPLALLIGALAVWGCFAAVRLNALGEGWATGVYASFIGMSIHFWAIAALTGTHAWFVYGLLAATIVLAKRRVRAKESVSVGRARAGTSKAPRLRPFPGDPNILETSPSTNSH